MKKVILGIIIFLISLNTNAQNRNCTDFEPGGAVSITGWQHNGNVRNITTESAVIREKDSKTHVLSITDGGGASIAYNATHFRGNWIQLYTNKCLCFDYKIDYNQAVEPNRNYAPKIMIYTGNNPIQGENWANGLTYATFVMNNVNVDNVWKNYCLPIGLANGNTLPSNEYGQWVVAGANPGQIWNTIIQNVSGIILPTDYNSEPSEVIQFDNFCANNCKPIVVSQCDCIPLGLYNEEITGSLFKPVIISGDFLNYNYKIQFLNPAFSQFNTQNIAWNNWINTIYGFSGGNSNSVVHQFQLYEVGRISPIDEFWIDAPNYNAQNEFNVTLSNNKSYYIKHGVYYGQQNQGRSPLSDACPWLATDIYMYQESGAGTSPTMLFKSKSGKLYQKTVFEATSKLKK